MDPLELSDGLGARTIAPIRSESRPVDRAIIVTSRERVSRASPGGYEGNLVSLLTIPHNQGPLIRLSNSFRGNSHWNLNASASIAGPVAG